MLRITIVTLLITSNIISRIQAEGREERKAQLNGTPSPVYKSNSVIIEALKVQKRDTLKIVPKSYVEQTNHVDESQTGNRLRRYLELDNSTKDFENKSSPLDALSNRNGPGIYDGSQVQQRNVNFPKSDGKYNVDGAYDVISGNNFSYNPEGTKLYGGIVEQENNTNQGKNENVQYEASVTQNTTESQGVSMEQNTSDSQGNSSSTNYDSDSSSHIESTTLHNEDFDKKWSAFDALSNSNINSSSQVHQENDNFPKSDGINQVYRYYDRDLNGTKMYGPIVVQEININQGKNERVKYFESHVTQFIGNINSKHTKPVQEININQGKNERVKYYESHDTQFIGNINSKHTKPNGQMSLSSNVFYSLSYSSIILLKYSLF